MYFIHKINELTAKYEELAKQEGYHCIQIRVVELGIPDMDYPSKLDRSSQLIEKLLKNGAELARCFFETASLWPRDGSIPAKSVVK